MPHDTPLIATIVAGLGLAFIFGALANRFRMPPLVGYLIAGVLVGPNTPGFVADQSLALELAEIGVILLMFGVGCISRSRTFCRCAPSPCRARSCRSLSRPCSAPAWPGWLGWTIGAGLVFGLALSVASTVVLLRASQERRLIETERGRIAVGWLIVEDLAMVLALVLLPALAGVLGGQEPAGPRSRFASGLFAPPADFGIWGVVGVTLAKVAAFVALMLVVGRRIIPWILHYVAHTGSRELFRLSVLAIALGVAFGASHLFGVSLALGRLLRRHDHERIRAQPPRRRGIAAAARRLLGAVLRLGRHAVRPDQPDRPSLADPRHALHHRHRQVGRRHS